LGFDVSPIDCRDAGVAVCVSPEILDRQLGNVSEIGLINLAGIIGNATRRLEIIY
jgi:hypothetical protein